MTGRQSYGDALARFYDELGGLRAEFPQLTTVPKRLLFYDLRARTKHSGLAGIEDAEDVLAHRAPRLSSDSRPTAAALLWDAWQRFLSDDDFEDDWLRLRGPQG